jgi:hypothetical protein
MGKRQVIGFSGVGLSVILGLAVGAAVAQNVVSEATKKAGAEVPSPQHVYIGVAGCRMCHNTKKQGEQVAIWKANKHSTAYETLKSDEALKMAAARGLKTAPVESPECLRCHATGWDLSEAQKTQFLKPAFKIEDGVQCETCHGPGDDYKTLKVMKDRSLALKAGLIIGDEKLCVTCHNDQSPAWKPDRFTTKDGKKVGFDYDACWEKIKHPVPKEAAE